MSSARHLDDLYGDLRSNKKQTKQRRRAAAEKHRRAQSLGTWLHPQYNAGCLATPPPCYPPAVAMATRPNKMLSEREPPRDVRYAHVQVANNNNVHHSVQRARASHQGHRRYRSWAAAPASIKSLSKKEKSRHPKMRRQSSLEKLARLEALVEAKQRELSQRGVIPESINSAREALELQQQPTRRENRSDSLCEAAERAEVLAYKVDDLEGELEQMRRRTLDICERVERLERERCRAPDIIDMQRGFAQQQQQQQQQQQLEPIREPVRFSQVRIDRQNLKTPEPVRSLAAAQAAKQRAQAASPSLRHKYWGPSPTSAFQTLR